MKCNSWSINYSVLIYKCWNLLTSMCILYADLWNIWNCTALFFFFFFFKIDIDKVKIKGKKKKENLRELTISFLVTVEKRTEHIRRPQKTNYYYSTKKHYGTLWNKQTNYSKGLMLECPQKVIYRNKKHPCLSQSTTNFWEPIHRLLVGAQVKSEQNYVWTDHIRGFFGKR